MYNNVIREKTYNFALRIVNLYKYICNSQKEYVLSKQVLRSGTSIGAMVEEALQAESKADFIHELAHAEHFALVGDSFFDYNFNLQELYAITRANGIQSYYGDALRRTWSPVIPFQPWKSTWWHYQIYGK